ncbi:uncharacterized protein [Apostichopus japonicus]|uniref:uncharacterized protein isoform X1 n=1 Tax=Stichopus japonicus TaxID=307972 RepID=UPI003AB81872
MHLLVYNSVLPVFKMLLLKKLYATWIFLYVITAGLRQATADKHNVQWQTTRTQLAKAGFPVELTCSFAFTESGYLVSWNKNGVNLVKHDPENSLTITRDGRMYNISTQEKTATLRIQDVSFDDAGEYSCRTVFPVNGRPEARYWKLVVQDGPILNSISSVMENQTLSAECCVTFTDSRIQVKYLWSIGVLLVTTYRSNVTENPTCSNVSFTATRQHHNKFLVCKIENNLNSSTQERINVTFLATIVIFSKQTYEMGATK